jgi:tRNA(fMet)-specific endonuclease VapC
MAVILDSSILVAFERRRFDLERFLTDHSPPAIAAITAAELLIGVERADTPERRARRATFVETILRDVAIIHFQLAQARLYAIRFAELTSRGQVIGDRDLQMP